MEHALAALFLLLLLSWLAVRGDASRDESLYDVLGVSRKANQKEIRSAYKKLAREWHPDKNKSPRAQEKILEINKAYEVLSTEDSRRHYDMTGETDSAPSTSQGHTHNHGFTFFQTGNGQFQFHFTGGGGFGHTHHPRKDTITTHYFRSTVLPESGAKLFLLNFFSDFCMQCSEVARVWDELREELISHGVGMASVHASFHHAISSHCGVDRVPAIVAVVNKRAFHYRGPLQARSIRNFVKGTLPSWIISELNSRNIDDFISDSIKLNKPRIILFSPHPQPSLLYKSVAFLNHHSIDFGFVSTDRASGNSLEFLQRFGVYSRAKKLLVFKEYPTPSVTVEESQLSSESLKSVVRGTRLHLPRLSSPKVMEDTCSNEGRLCLVLLVSGPASYNNSITDAFRASAVTVSSPEGGGYFSVAYMDEEKQRMFVSSLEKAQETLNHCPSGEKPRSVLLLRRKTGFQTLYDWYNGYCGSKQDWEDLISFATETSLQYSAVLPELEDEFAPGVLTRAWYSIVERWYQLYDYFSTSNSQSLSLLTMVCGMAVMMCCVSLLGPSQSEEEQGRRKRTGDKNRSHGSATNSTQVLPLDSQLYHRCVEHAHKGSIAVLLLTDLLEDNLVNFSKTVKQYRSRHFNFFRGSLEKNRSWLQELLSVCSMGGHEKEWRKQMYFGEEKLKTDICILALIGSKKQFAIFPESRSIKSHTNHFTESSSDSIVNGTSDKPSSGTINDFLSSFGFEEDDRDDAGHGEGGRGFIQRLVVWMERLEDGSLKRYSVDYWPQWHA